MPIQRIHHINFIVKDLNEGVNRYEALLGEGVFVKDQLPLRGVITARAKLGEQWLVLVQPVDTDSVPGKHLQEHGEGFFLMSLGVDNLDEATAGLQEKGIAFADSEARQGLLNWRVRDLEGGAMFGAQVQLCEDNN